MEVIYERDTNVGNGFQAYRGRAQTADEVKEFDGFHFEALLRLLSKMLQPSDLGITFIRSDRPELQPYPLENELVELIRDNVEAAIERMSHPDVRIVVGRPPAPPDVIRSGGDTLAGAFGDSVLCRRRDYLVECPCCGMWAPITGGASGAWAIECSCGLKSLLFKELPDSNWLAVKVGNLLSPDYASVDRFFLPREWNNYQPWVSREKLEQLYADFQKLKEQFNVR